MRLDHLPLGPVRAAARSGRGMLEGEAERAVEALFAGPLPETVGRSLAENHVIERVVSGMLGNDGVPAGSAAAGEDGAALAEELTERLVQTAAFRQALEDVLSSPEIRAALSSQAGGFGAEIAAACRRRAGVLDDRLEATVRRLLRRNPAQQPSRFGGLATRGVGLVLDAALAQLGFIVAAASIGLVLALAGDLHPSLLPAALAGAGWFLAAAIYFVLFWSGTGQTPGMRVMRVRVTTASGAPPSAFRSLVRFVGLILAIVPLFAGFLPVVVDARRRALQDFLSGTVVVETGP